MGFLSGLLTGAATSIDNQLKADMKRTEERMDGMEQYRVTRRRAKLEDQEKEKKELKEMLTSLAAYTGGDEDKAIQLFNHAGKTIDGGKDLIQTLKTNRDAGKNIDTVIEYAEAGAEPGNFTSFINSNITPITPMLSADGEPMKASGLHGLFSQDLDTKINRRVDAAAPIPTVDTSGTPRTAMASIDYTQLLTAEEAKFEKSKRAGVLAAFDLDAKKFNLLSEETKAAMKRADAAQRLAEKIGKSNMDETVKASARADAAQANDNARLLIAQGDAIDRATAALGTRELAGLEIQIKKLDLDKLKDAPEFATYEAMMVAADNELFAMEMLPVSGQDAARMAELKSLRATGLKGMQDAAATSDTGTAYSTTTAENSYQIQLNRELKTVGLYDSLTESVSALTDGNAADFLTAQARAIDNTRLSNVKNDPTMMKILEGARNSLNADLQNVARQKFETYATDKADAEASNVAFEPSDYDVTDAATIGQEINNIKVNQSAPDLSDARALQIYAKQSNLKKGHIVETNSGVFLMWTGTKFIGA